MTPPLPHALLGNCLGSLDPPGSKEVPIPHSQDFHHHLTVIRLFPQPPLVSVEDMWGVVNSGLCASQPRWYQQRPSGEPELPHFSAVKRSSSSLGVIGVPVGNLDFCTHLPEMRWCQRRPSKSQDCNKEKSLIISQISRFQSKITCHNNYQKDYKLKEKRKSAFSNVEMTQMLELFDQGFKEAIIKMLQCRITDVFDINEK